MRMRRLRLGRRKRRAQEVVLVATSSSHGETEDDLEGCASSIAVRPDFLNPMQNLSLCSIQSGAEAAMTSPAVSGPSSSPFFSARSQSLSERRNDLGSQSESEIESSKSHWTETSDGDDEGEQERESDRVTFEELKNHPIWGPFFRREPYELEIGEKIAEGGQAKIFEALGTNKHDYISARNVHERKNLVVKVFKRGCRLEAVQRLWPPELAAAALPYRYFHRSASDQYSSEHYGLCFSVGAQLLEDGRFAFIFDRFTGDLRTLINRRMVKSNGAPPFLMRDARMILLNIAKGMAMLHKLKLLHKDLKAANVLMLYKDGQTSREFAAYIADFESSVGIAGTGFWRAPEVLLALKNRSLVSETFTQQSDVYSYAMTCYKVLTGRVPFEGHRTYDMILGGARPPLPDDIGHFFKNLFRICWHTDPLQRPSFDNIVARLRM